MKAQSFFKMVDGNGLALMCFGFGSFMFAAFNLNIDGVGFADTGPDKHFGVHFIPDMLTWGVGMGLIVAGIIQGVQGDQLGFTSYIFHAAILGSIGYNFEDLLKASGGNSLYLTSWLCYAAAFVNLIFTVMASRAAVVFGILYFSVAIMFLVVGLNFSQKLDNSGYDASITTGSRFAGVTCLNVSLQCFLLLIPVMTGKLGFLFAIPNPFAAAPKEEQPSEAGVIEPQTKIKLVDANPLALSAFGFAALMFFIFKCNVDGVNWGNQDDPTDKHTNHASVHMLTGMLTWGAAMTLLVAGIFQFLNGDHLGFTSYIFHSAILGTTGYWLDNLLSGFGSSTYIYSYFFYCAFYFNLLFTAMAFKIAKMFGVLYATVALMFLVVGLDWSQVMDDSETDPKAHAGSMIGGVVCLLVAVQCFYLMVPLLTGKGPLF